MSEQLPESQTDAIASLVQGPYGRASEITASVLLQIHRSLLNDRLALGVAYRLILTALLAIAATGVRSPTLLVALPVAGLLLALTWSSQRRILSRRIADFEEVLFRRAGGEPEELYIASVRSTIRIKLTMLYIRQEPFIFTTILTLFCFAELVIRLR